MKDITEIFILLLIGGYMSVLLIGSVVLYKGGWFCIGQEYEKSNRVQKYCAFGEFYSLLTVIPYVIINYVLPEPSPLLRRLADFFCLSLLAVVPMLAKAIKQERITAKDIILYGSILIPLLIAIFTIADTYPQPFRILRATTFYFIIGENIFWLYRLHKWDKSLLNMYSDVKQKQTKWFFNLTIPVLGCTLLWIPLAYYPEQRWLEIVYYSICIVVFLRFTAHALRQEVFDVPEDVMVSMDNGDLDSKSMQQEENIDDATDGQASWVKRLTEVMSEECIYRKPSLDLNELARAIGANRTYLSRYINNNLNTNFYNYVNSYRLKEACHLLSTTSQTLEAIAQQCGFKNHLALIHAFKQKYNCTPTEWRKPTE